MKIPVTIVCVLCAVALFAAPVERKEVPAFPNAVISIEGPQGHKSSHRAEDMVQAALPRGSVEHLEMSHLEGSEALSVDAKSAGSISWRHVARTEFGDLYLVFRTSPEGKQEAASLLFDGKSEVSWRCGDWRIGISR